MSKEITSWKRLRQELKSWQERHPAECEVPLEIQERAKEFAKVRGYRYVARHLDIDPSRLYSKVGMVLRKTRRQSIKNPHLSATTVTAIENISKPIKVTSSLRAQLKNGVVLEVTAPIEDLAEFAKKLGA